MSTQTAEKTTGAAHATTAPAKASDGKPGPPEKTLPSFRIFAFHGGGLDTVMQLGIAHALLLAEGRIAGKRPLDMIAGISAGAINAVALAEILQAGDASDSTEQRLAAQVARLLEFLEGYRNAPATVLRGFLPDLYETTHRQALKSVVLPRHFGAERRTREESIATRAGIIRLLNGLLDVRVSVGTVVRFIRLKLGWNAAHELVWWRRYAVRTGLLRRGWWLAARNCAVLSQPLGRLAVMTVREGLLQLARGSAPKREEGVEAAAMMFDANAVPRRLGAAACWLAGFALLAGLLSGVLPALLLAVALALPLLLPFFALAAAPFVALAALLSLVAWPGVRKKRAVFARHAERWLADFPRRLRRCGQVGSLLLEHYSILSDLGDSYALKEALVRLFDPKYFGEFRLDTGLGRALRSEREDVRAAPNRHRRRLDAYEKNCPWRPLKVVPLAANLRTGRIEALPRRASVVDALMAACAVVPFFRAQSLRVPGKVPRRQWFIDGVNVSNDPVTEALGCLREDEATVEIIRKSNHQIRIYSVPLLPIEQDALPGRVETYTRLVDVGLRALQLQRFQDAQLTKKLVETYRRALPPSGAVFDVPPPEPGKKTKAFFLTELVHLTPPRPLDLNTRIPGAANAEERRALMESAVADGCRALLERLLTEEKARKKDPGLHEVALGLWQRREITVRGDDAYVPCKRLFAEEKNPLLRPLPGNSSAVNPGPGLPDICQRCAAIRGRTPAEDALPQHVRLPWKIAAAAAPPAEDRSKIKAATDTDPAVAFLFSGGVFRGVFQVGFANAVSELGLLPDIVVGASVGTIIGALIGRVLKGENLGARRFQMQRLAGTFLAIDQFVMTDRFADFVRHLSVRAAGADFSLRDADLFFRRYDTGASAPLADRARRVIAGLERVFYISPFELRDFAETLRTGDYRSSWSQVKGFVQDWLDQSGVGLELLGPEPLEMLINGIIFDDRPPAHAGFDSFATRGDEQPGFQLLGTTTNLTKGKLEILRAEKDGAQLLPGLLASSAFPAVFRPRWSWELFAQTNSADQFCDGGVMDNLPLDSVVEYLSAEDKTTGCWRYLHRPEVPHLILTASLEPDPEDWTDGNLFPPEKIQESAGSWPVLKSRAGELRYNEKISKFAGAQKYIRQIIEQRKKTEKGFKPEDENLPLNLEVAVVKPQWLCSTFAFHPMLGFRRRDQAASIAHGCAATIQLLAGLFSGPLADPQRRDWGRKKGVQVAQLDGAGKRRELTAAEQADGVCWHRCAGAEGKEPLCPFSAAVVGERALREETAGAEPLTKKKQKALENERATLARELDAIYRACGQPATHARR